jgi:hypothetical protein
LLVAVTCRVTSTLFPAYARRRRRTPANRLTAPSPSRARPANRIGREEAPVRASPPAARVDEAPSMEVAGAVETVAPTELLV